MAKCFTLAIWKQCNPQIIMNQTIIDAILMAGLPLCIISFILFAWGYKSRHIKDDLINIDELESDPDALLKDLTEQPSKGSFIFDQWFQFGGGYYGTMCLITFLHLEFNELVELSAQLYDASSVQSLIQLLMLAFIQLFQESILNFVHAFLWWNHWANVLPVPASQGFIWLVSSYVGYIVGQWLAGQWFANQKE